MNNNMNFHQTFPPEREAIAQILNLAAKENGALNKDEISNMTTIPTGDRSGKVVPTIRYAEYMGLLDVENIGGYFKLSLTSLGRIINNEDPYLSEPITIWACHYNLTSKESKAGLWSYVFNDIIPQLGTSFSKEVFSNIINKNFLKEINLTPLRSCYLNDRSFGNLGLMKEEGNKYLFTPHKIDPTYKYLYAYQLLLYWERHLGDRTEITIDEIKDHLYFGNSYIWTERDLLNLLDLLQDERIILMNRQLSPITVVKQENSKNMLKRIYSLLI
ncbi:DUF4007 family protein [Brevibacterium sp. PAMC21349]|nr:DUF4007 family protein [Brevibacterium sp. PAMC21349]